MLNLTKEEYKIIDEIKPTQAWKLMKKVLEQDKDDILRTFASIRSRETIDKEGCKIIESADSQIQRKLGEISKIEKIINLVEDSYKNSKNN
jgi:hypothetical protein